MQSKGFWKWFDITVSLVMVIAVPVLASGTTFTFTQTNWGGGITANVPDHTNNRTGWTEYTSTSTSMGVMNAGADIQIATSTATLTQTNDGTTNTGFNLSGAATSSTEVMGSGSAAAVRLTASSGFGAVTAVDTTATAGQYQSIAVDSNNKAHIAYDEDSANDVKYATNASESWVTSIIDSSRNAFYTDIDIDTQNKVHISHGNSTLVYMTNATSSSPWSIYTVDASATVGQFTDIELDTQGYAHISYFDATNLNLKYATNASGSWAITTVDNYGGHTGRWTSLALDSQNKAHILYQDLSNADLIYATNASGSWATSTVDTPGAPGAYSSLKIDSNDVLYGLYYSSTGTGSLKYATKSDGVWATSTIATGVNDPLYGTSMDLDSGNKVHAVYYYSNGSAGDLRYITNATGNWASSTLVSVDNVGLYASIAIDSEDTKHISYWNQTQGDLYYITEAVSYAASGTYTSGPINLGVGALGWGNLSWTETLNGGTVTLKARSDADGDFTNAADWASCTSISNGSALSTGNCVNNDHQYIQYQASLSTPDTATTPSLSDVTIGYATYATGQSLTSSIFNTESLTTAIESLSWVEDASFPDTESLVVELRTASTSAGITSSTWYDFNSVTVNCTKTDGTVTCPASALPTAVKDVTDDQYFQYRVTLQTDAGSSTPTLSEVSVGYVPDAGVGPTVNTQDATSLTTTSATLNGNIIGTGGTDVTTRGFAYGTDATFATVIATTTDTVGQPFSTGTFTHSLTGLTCGTAYYVRAYATNTAGTGFGFDKAFMLTCETETGGGGSNRGGGEAEEGETAPPPANEAVGGPAEEDPFRLPVFNHTERPRRFDPARNTTPPDEDEREAVAPSAPPPADDGGGGTTPVFTRAVRSIQTVAEETITLIASTTEQIVPIAAPLGVLTGTFTLVGTAMPTGMGFAFSLAHLWHLLLSALGFRKRKPWGVVYDSVTKHPISPAKIRLLDEFGKDIETSYTDFEGRYGFLVEPGTYRVEIERQNYAFPSKSLQGRHSDGLYTNLYFGGPLSIVGDGALLYNIPLDPVGLDWKEFSEQSYKRFHFYSEADRVIHFVFRWIFRIGFIAALYTLITAPSVLDLSIIGLYLIIGLSRFLGFGPRPYGYLTDTTTQAPLAFALVTIRDARTHKEVTRAIADHLGRYHALVPDGEYVIEIARKEGVEEYRKIYTSAPVAAHRGLIRENLEV